MGESANPPDLHPAGSNARAFPPTAPAPTTRIKAKSRVIGKLDKR